jgi:hypothetical protein
MTGYKPAIGDRVRVTYEGTVIKPGPGDWQDELRIQMDGGYGSRLYRKNSVTFEKVKLPTPPEPDRTALVICSQGDVWHFLGSAWGQVNTDGGSEEWKWPVLVDRYGPLRVFQEAS